MSQSSPSLSVGVVNPVRNWPTPAELLCRWSTPRAVGLVRWLTGLCGLAGLIAATGCSTYEAPTVTDPDRRAGHVFMIRGLFNIFSTGMAGLVQQVRDNKIDAHDCAWANNATIWEALTKLRVSGDREPIVLGGHSNGADDAIRLAWLLAEQDTCVDLLIMIDEWLPPPVPRNVKRVLMIYTRGFGNLAIAAPHGPWLVEPQVERFTINPIAIPGVAQVFGQIQHFTIDKDSNAHRKIVEEIVAACPPHTAWLASRRADELDHTPPNPAGAIPPVTTAPSPSSREPTVPVSLPAPKFPPDSSSVPEPNSTKRSGRLFVPPSGR